MDTSYDTTTQVLKRFHESRNYKMNFADVWQRMALAYLGRRPDNAATLLALIAGTQISPYDNRSQARVNVVQRFVRTMVAKLLSQRPEPHVAPESGADDDRAAARGCEDFLRYFFRSKDMASKMDMVALYDVLYGTGVWRLGWNREGGEPVDYDVEAIGADLAGMLPSKSGELDIWSIDPHYAFPQPGVSFLRDSRWAIVVHRLHLDYVYERWGKRVDGDADPTILTPPLPFIMGTTDAKELATVFEYWERPSPEFRNGRYIVTTNQEVLDSAKELPEGDIPLVFIPFNRVPGTIFGRTPIEDLLPIQALINHAATKISKTLETSGHKFVVQRGGLDIHIGAEPGETVEYATNTNKPDILQPAGVNPQQFTWLETLLSWAKMVTGVSDVMFGESPGSDPSGRSVRFLSEEANVAFGQAVLTYREGLAEIARLALNIFRANAPAPLLISIAGRAGARDVRKFQASDVRYRDVEIEVESQDAYTKQAERDAFMQLVQLGKITDNRTILEFFDQPTEDTMYGEDVDQRTQAQEENDVMAASSIPADPADWENHDEHASCHTAFMRTAKFRALNPQVQAAAFRHLFIHQAFLSNGQTPFPTDYQPWSWRISSPSPSAQSQGQPGASAQNAALPSPLDASVQNGNMLLTPSSQAAQQIGMEHNPALENAALQSIRGPGL